MKKHVYCLTVHGNIEVLKTFLRMADNSENDIFLLPDKKSPEKFHQLLNTLLCKKSGLTILPAMDIFWAGVSQIKAELILLKAAVKAGQDYEYIHFMQGADLPLKTQKEIHGYFHEKAKEGWQFVEYNPNLYEFAKYKVCYYHFFVNNRFFRTNKILKACNHFLAKMQKAVNLKRRNEDKIYAGSALFSITQDCAVYLLKNAGRILKEYQFTLAGDEVWLQMELIKSPYKEKLYGFEKVCEGNSRYIVWDRKRKNHNSPYTFTVKDFEELKRAGETTELCFARKFEEKEDMEIVRKIERWIQDREGTG